ncbi:MULTISPECIES: hypothetical protein [unclassified Pseudodesulfovibrio]|uniref:hypothetical protein n=1 Tax=unclassified Pseudodesulfovibrio TaxID=2661612 RepID=UPI000FEBE935|nr:MULTISPECIES: hypothetical protein [unclassified Pseudodesulfovibrio]MCJ2165929.1 hypothetical protein [Pseudodesulfovibrio sp. S3-i]RWU02605.1 hypothetical protein DWB63_15180 [Pseudodesulfovibrio sp. S3]
MKQFILILICLFVVGCTSAKKKLSSDSIVKPSELSDMSASEVESALVKGHPANYFTLAAKLFSEGKKQEGVKWFYVGQIRYRAYLQANPSLKPSEDPALFSSLMYSVGTPLNEYIGGDIDEWIATIDEAVQWHNNNPDYFLDKDKNEEVYESVLSGVEKLKKHIVDNQDSIRKKRVENGLENR